MGQPAELKAPAAQSHQLTGEWNGEVSCIQLPVAVDSPLHPFIFALATVFVKCTAY